MKEVSKCPFELVASILKVPVDSLDENSTMGQEPNWDSFNHLSIIVEIEKTLKISIPDDDIMKYCKMSAIIELFNRYHT